MKECVVGSDSGDSGLLSLELARGLLNGRPSVALAAPPPPALGQGPVLLSPGPVSRLALCPESWRATGKRERSRCLDRVWERSKGEPGSRRGRG